MFHKIFILLISIFGFDSIAMDLSGKDKKNEISPLEEELCSICLDNLDAQPVLVLSCHTNHKFHAICTQDYAVKKYQTCPIIRCRFVQKRSSV